MSRAALYMETCRHLGADQVAARVWRRLGGETHLSGWRAHEIDSSGADPSRAPALPELDFDPAFLARFDADAIVGGRVELLHVAVDADWASPAFWQAEVQAPLWRFNLHYHEYLLPLAKAYLSTGTPAYLDKAKEIVLSWIDANPQGQGGPGWDPYAISMRAVCWLALRAECADAFSEDAAFSARMDASLAEQAAYLARHMETDILANHYLEGCKALVLLSLYLGDEATLGPALAELERQVDEQILPDGGHFELSPMYQKIVLEDLLRVAVTLREVGRPSEPIEDAAARMCSLTWSLERGLPRTLLFNDSGDNVAKGLDSLLACAKLSLGIEPEFRTSFPDSGFEVMESGNGRLKCVFKTGRTNPPIAMAHMHCDALSFELFRDGIPVIVNCGTYAYQGELRPWFRSTEAGVGVVVDGCEQHECWAQFRVARYGQGGFVSREVNRTEARFTDYLGHSGMRQVELFDDAATMTTATTGSGRLTCRYHLAEGLTFRHDGDSDVFEIPKAGCEIRVAGNAVEWRIDETWRADEFGQLGSGQTLVVESDGSQAVSFGFTDGGGNSE